MLWKYGDFMTSPEDPPRSTPIDAEDRTITQPEVLRAYAHPTRLRMLDLLRVDGPLTVSMIGERLDAAVGSISHHLKMLAAADLVVEVPEKARDRREHWWTVPRRRTTWSRQEMTPAAAQAALQAEELALDRQNDLFKQAMHTPTDDPWFGPSFANSTWLQLRPDELDQLSTELLALVERWNQRSRAHQDAGDLDTAPVLFVSRAARVTP